MATEPLVSFPGAGGLEDAEHGVDEGTICFLRRLRQRMVTWMWLSRATEFQEALYHNNGNGTFTDVTLASGLTPRGNALGLAWGDYDNDRVNRSVHFAGQTKWHGRS
jgi:hypothetical protein